MIATTLTPMKAIRRYCTTCCGGAAQGENSPAGCNSPACPLYPLRSGRAVRGIGRLRAIRQRCRECVGTPADIRRCAERTCPLWPHRSGHRPTPTWRGRAALCNRFQGIGRGQDTPNCLATTGAASEGP